MGVVLSNGGGYSHVQPFKVENLMQRHVVASGKPDFELAAQLYECCMSRRQAPGEEPLHDMKSFAADIEKIRICEGVCPMLYP